MSKATITFTVSDVQAVRVEKWKRRRIHVRATCHIKEWAFSRASGIGESLRVRCSCGHELDATDYASW